MNKGANKNENDKGKNAYVTLVMCGTKYIPGALMLGYSLRQARTIYDRVCMVTNDVPETDRLLLKQEFDHVILIDYLQYPCQPLKTNKQQEMYGSWIDKSFTKWVCLSLKQYNKILFIDADVIVLRNMDHLFCLHAPAATFSSPWSKEYVRRKEYGLANPYQNIHHGEQVPLQSIDYGFKSGHSFVAIGGLVLLEPSDQDYQGFVNMMNQIHDSKKLFGSVKCNSGYDEQSIVFYFSHIKQIPWYHIHQRYQLIPWHKNWLDGKTPFAFHFLSKKPWEMKRDEWPDLEAYWELVDQWTLEHKHIQSSFIKYFNNQSNHQSDQSNQSYKCAYCNGNHKLFYFENNHNGSKQCIIQCSLLKENKD